MCRDAVLTGNSIERSDVGFPAGQVMGGNGKEQMFVPKCYVTLSICFKSMVNCQIHWRKLGLSVVEEEQWQFHHGL